MNRYRGIDDETMERALDTIMRSDLWSEAEKAKFLEDWRETRRGRLAEQRRNAEGLHRAMRSS
jgi:hypothetical protein